MSEPEDKYAYAKDVGHQIFGQMSEQAGAGICCIAGIEIAALGLDNPKKGEVASRSARLGAIQMFAHRVIEGDFVNPRTHLAEVCLICMKIKELIR